jgi:hypothetical protein
MLYILPRHSLCFTGIASDTRKPSFFRGAHIMQESYGYFNSHYPSTTKIILDDVKDYHGTYDKVNKELKYQLIANLIEDFNRSNRAYEVFDVPHYPDKAIPDILSILRTSRDEKILDCANSFKDKITTLIFESPRYEKLIREIYHAVESHVYFQTKERPFEYPIYEKASTYHVQVTRIG